MMWLKMCLEKILLLLDDHDAKYTALGTVMRAVHLVDKVCLM